MNDGPVLALEGLEVASFTLKVKCFTCRSPESPRYV